MPGFRETILSLTVELRVVVFFVCVAGLVAQVARAREEGAMLEPVVRAIVVVGLVATLPYWFELTEKVFLGIADTVNHGYTERPMQAAGLLRDAVKEEASSFSLQRVHESLYQAFLWAAAKLVVLVGSVLQLPFLLLQHILKLLCFLFLPVALALFMVPGLAPLGARYVQQTLAVLAWPVGFAVTELVTFNLVTSYQHNLAMLDGSAAGQVNGASLASLLGGILGVVWLVVGTLGTPVVMQLLFCSGTPVTAGAGSALSQLSTLRSAVLMAKSVKTGGAALPLAVAAAGGRAGGAGKDGAGPRPPGTPPPAPGPHRPTAADPGGDRAAAAARSRQQLPKPWTTI
ncbi:MAG: hypothetical protein JSR48_00315 [Verrucomicrobia bacterium]|nr:hypothetical protein [Verrucomicrobiota bacterium]